MKNLTEHLGEHQNYENHGRIRWTLGKFRKQLGTPITKCPGDPWEKIRKLLENGKIRCPNAINPSIYLPMVGGACWISHI